MTELERLAWKAFCKLEDLDPAEEPNSIEYGTLDAWGNYLDSFSTGFRAARERWISPSESLPPLDKAVIVSMRHEGGRILVLTGYWSGNGWWNHDAKDFSGNVIGWQDFPEPMPLPDAPAGKEEA